MNSLIRKLKNLFLRIENNSDGYHTFKELYDHRVALFVELCKANKENAWWSFRHSDGTEAFGYPWIIMGIGYKPGHQITYHINTHEYQFFDNVRNEIKQLDFAPTFDFHSPNDVVLRLKTGEYKR